MNYPIIGFQSFFPHKNLKTVVLLLAMFFSVGISAQTYDFTVTQPAIDDAG